MKKYIDIAVDIETLSCQSDAAIISLAAVPFDKSAEKLEQVYVDGRYYYEVVNATTCAMAGMHFDTSTVAFWQSQPDEAKRDFYTVNAASIREALEGFVDYLEQLKQGDDVELRIWCQGAHFDEPILRNAILKVLGTCPPWDYRSVRDARTYILEAIAEKRPEEEDPYSLLPKLDGVKHNALWDARQLAVNVWAAKTMRWANC